MPSNVDVFPPQAASSQYYVVCTSTTRPAAPLVGQMIFETNTKIAYLWTGSNWREISAPRYAAMLYRSTNLAVTAGFATTTVPMNALNWADDNTVFQGGADYTCPIAGLYRVQVNIETDTGIMASVSLVGIEGGGIPVSSSRATRINSTGFGNYNAGQVIQVGLWNDGDVASNIREGVQFTWMQVERIGPRYDSGAVL